MHAAPKGANVWPSDAESLPHSLETSRPRGLQVQRLKTRDQYQAVLAGKIVARTAHFAMHSLTPDHAESMLPPAPLERRFPALFNHSPAWIGAMVPKRWARKAVTRNLIKRQIYSMARCLEAILPHGAHVVRLRHAFDRHQYKSAGSDLLKSVVRSEIEHLLSQAAAVKTEPVQ
jgi:ribonuclease P protein component